MVRLTSHLRVLGILLLLAAPLRADVFGGIEIGGKGVKATVLEVLPGEDLDVKVKFSDTTNTAMAAGIAKTGSFDPAAVAETAKAVAAYREKFVKEYAVDPAKIRAGCSRRSKVSPMSSRPTGPPWPRRSSRPPAAK
jgi:hypothetical protein